VRLWYITSQSDSMCVMPSSQSLSLAVWSTDEGERREEGAREARGGRELRILSVCKVVLALTSKSVEICLSMAGAKQYRDTGFILVPVVGRTFSRGVLVALDCNAPWCS
jgi:hypothetical protein